LSSNISHAAALALAGWYLMTPPIYQQLRLSPVPRSKWVINGKFDSAEKRDKFATKYSAELVKKNKIRAAVDFAQTYQCVSIDDPQLKETLSPELR
jgi:hypothetical protein